jgi:2-methylisocitrate lyase-like PEP mutase family enzyme
VVTGLSARAIVGRAAGCRETEPAMATTTEDKRAAFRQLHERGCFVIPNPWDVGSARLLQHLGFAALATTSAGFAWSRGRPDYAVTVDDVLGHLGELCPAVDVPVNADFESGFARDAAGVADHVTRALATGVAGLSIEDRDVDPPYPLFALDHAVERVKAARAAVDADGGGAVLVARTERLLREPAAVTTAIDALVAFADAGADCLFAPGVRDPASIAAMVRAVAPRPLNVLMMRPGPSVRELEDLGVRRISVGGALARVAWGAVIEAARQMYDGSFDGLAAGAPAGDLNAIFGGFGG